MRVLWFTNTPSRYKQDVKGYNGGGWISSLEESLTRVGDIELAVAFYHPDDVFKVSHNDVTYYPISIYNTPLKKLKHNLFYNTYDRLEVDHYLRIIEDFKPDIIHVFGSEKSFGLVSKHVRIPVVIHIQGILTPYLNAWFPPGCSKLDYFRFYSSKKLIDQLKNYKFFKHNAKREESILRNCNNFIGRTQWDKNVVRLYSPTSRYFYCSEILRNVFYEAAPWVCKKLDKVYITSVISRVDYKGFDLILKASSLLKGILTGFEWRVFGIKEYDFWERKLGIKCQDVNVKLMGVANAQQLIDALHNSTLYVHPSYIDNSPNSLCEAQMLGMPVISTNVGGISSLIEDGVTGILVPANDPFTLAAQIISLSHNEKQAKEIGWNAREVSVKRHNRDAIVQDNISVYRSLINSNVVAVSG